MLGYDAIIVLANEMDLFGKSNKESMARANLAKNLANDLKIPYIITCGWAYRNDSNIKIADAFRDYLINEGISDNRLITEPNSRDTVGDAIFTRANIAEAMGFRRLCIVTSNYHVQRTNKIFRFVYDTKFFVSVEGAEVEYGLDTLKKELDSTLVFERTFKGIKAGDLEKIIHRLRHKHPFYNGNIYKSI